MTIKNSVKLNIDEKIQSYAKIYASLLSDEFQRKRAYVSLIALYAFVDTLEPTYNVQKSMTLFRNPQINEQYEISDIYVNGWHIDVRVIADCDAVLIPKIHYDSNIVPDFYIVVKLDSALKTAELIGAIDAKNVEKDPFDYHYYSVPVSSFIDYKEFLAKLETEKVVSHTFEDHELFRTSYLSLLDNNLDVKTKNKVLKHLFECSVCRTEFCCFTGFEMVCSNTSKYPEILDDHTLGYIGAQNADDTKYVGKEETIYIGSDDNKKENASVEIEKKVDDEPSEATVSAILDNLFDIDEGGEVDEIVEETSEQSENIPEKEEPKNEIVEQSEEISSIDEILEEVAASSNIQLENSEQKESEDLEFESSNEQEQDLHLIDDGVSLDSPQKTQKTGQEDEDFKIVAEDNVNPYNKDEDMEVISDEKIVEEVKENDELVMLSEGEEEELIEVVSDENHAVIDENESAVSEIETIQDEIQEVYPTEEELVITHTDEEFEKIEDEIIDEATMLSKEEPVQKVIVDYDEFGEPIYSYITEIDDSQASDDEIYEIKEDEFEEYPEKNEASEIENIPDSDEADEEEYESVYSDDEDENENENEEEDGEEKSNELDEQTEDSEQLEADNEEVQSQESLSEDENEEYTEEYAEENSEENEASADEDDNTDENEENTQVDGEDTQEEYEEDEEYEEEDDDQDGDMRKSSNPMALIISILVLLGLAGGGVFYFLNKGKYLEEQPVVESTNENVIEVAENPAVNDMFEQPVENQQNTVAIETSATEQQTLQEDILPALPKATASRNVTMPELTESDLIKPQRRNSNGDVNKTIVNAFATNPSPVSLRALNWFCASALFSDMNFKNYLQTIDESLKQNLKSNFMNLVEAAPKDSVTAKFAVDNRGNLKKVIISESSGSEEIDNVVLQSINETFEREKSQILNDIELKQDMYYLKVVIKL